MISWLKKLLGSEKSAPNPTPSPGSFAEAEARVARVREKLLAAPPVELLGVVSPSGTGGSKGGPGTPWHVGCSLVAWRVAGGPLREGELHITRQVEYEELGRWQESLPAYAVRRLRARLLMQSEMGPRAWLEEVIGPARDAELEAIAAILQEAVTHEDEVFGTCTLDRALHWYSARGLWMGREVDVHLSTDKAEELPALLAQAHGLWAKQPEWHERLLDCALTNLLELKNDVWLGDGESEVTPAQFKARMELQSVTLYGEDELSFCFGDGNLFWGHVIMVEASFEDGPTGAEIAG